MEEVENSDNGPIPKKDDLSPSPVKSCALCGCSTPAVRCDRCNSQIFCLSCDDMYHKHPKRKLHLRKAVDSIWNSARSPRLRRRTELPGDPSKIPIPPPRSRKRERHTISGRMFLKPHHELGSFGHSKVEMRAISPFSKDVFAGQKSPMSLEATYENEATFPASNIQDPTKPNDLYENEGISVNQSENPDDSDVLQRSPWDLQRTNISSPIQVSIPSNSPDRMTTEQSFGYPMKPQSRSIADLPGAPSNPIGPHPYHFPPYPYMHPQVQHPSFSHSMSHLNCAQCLSSPWSNVMSPHPSPYFHPMPWGSAHGSLTRGAPPTNGQMHSQGNLPYMDSNFQYPYPGPHPFFANGVPMADPTVVSDTLQQREESPRLKKTSSRQTLSAENLEAVASVTPQPDLNETEKATARNIGRNKEEDDPPPPVPKPSTEPWSCLHCTFVNPAGIYICQICCKTSYGNPSDAHNEDRALESRYSNSPELVNLDALPKSPDFAERAGHKVIGV